MTDLDDYRAIRGWAREDVERSRRELDEYIQSLGLGLDEVMTIRAVIGGWLADYSLEESNLGMLMARIVLVIGKENMLKALEEMRHDD